MPWHRGADGYRTWVRVGGVLWADTLKFERESQRAGKASFQYAWILDETEEERSRYDVGCRARRFGRARF